VLIVAGPGTGKTRTLTHRIAHLVGDCGVAPEQCLALTFSRRAAAEMGERLERLLPGKTQRVPVMTFHALGLCVLREQGARLGLEPSWRVAGDMERSAMLAQALSISPTRAKQLLERISRHKRLEHGGDPPSRSEDAEAIETYRREMRRRAWLDFDDLIALPLQLLRTDPVVLDSYRSRYRWISVDEFQDIDGDQYELVRRLAPADGNLCVIGDPDQAIYGFRGADHRSFQRFRDDYPAARTIVLTRNYRSTQTIVDAALQAIAPSSLVAKRRLDAEGAGPEQIEIHACATDRAEAEFLVHAIERMLGGWSFFSLDSQRAEAHEGEALSFADFAVLYRTEAQSGALVEALERSGIPFQRRSHDRLVDQPTVQAILDGMVAVQQGGLAAIPVIDLLSCAIEQAEGGEPASAASLAALRSLAERHGSNLPQFLSEVALGADVDSWDPRADRVSLLTLHAAKGLEFPVVFIVGCEDGLMPLHWGAMKETEEAEERRLLFVGMTRARQRLILTHARKRRLKGPVRASSPSPFLNDIERALLAFHEHRAMKKPSVPDPQRTLFDGM
jgi:superfamily I DNA/RNA helicase